MVAMLANKAANTTANTTANKPAISSTYLLDRKLMAPTKASQSVAFEAISWRQGLNYGAENIF